jgi:hypothetical protein
LFIRGDRGFKGPSGRGKYVQALAFKHSKPSLSLSLSLSLSRVCDFFFLLNISCFVFQKTKYLLSGAMGNVIIFHFSLIIA